MGAVELASLCRFGVFSAADARRAGVAPNRLAGLVAAGQAHPLIRGWYSAVRPTDPTDRHRLMAVAAYRRFDGRAMASHHSALVLHGLPTYLADLATVHLTRTIEGSSRRGPGVVLHPRLPGAPVRGPGAGGHRHRAGRPGRASSDRTRGGGRGAAGTPGDTRVARCRGRSSLFDEKQREDALRRAGSVVVRFVWSELDDVELIRRRVEDAIAASRS
jgi:hypothetical protein